MKSFIEIVDTYKFINIINKYIIIKPCTIIITKEFSFFETFVSGLSRHIVFYVKTLKRWRCQVSSVVIIYSKMVDQTRRKLQMPNWYAPYLEKHRIYELFHVSSLSCNFYLCIFDDILYNKMINHNILYLNAKKYFYDLYLLVE